MQGRGSLERRHGAALDSLAQRSDDLGGVGATVVFTLPGATVARFGDTTEAVVFETASEKEREMSSPGMHAPCRCRSFRARLT